MSRSRGDEDTGAVPSPRGANVFEMVRIHASSFAIRHEILRKTQDDRTKKACPGSQVKPGMTQRKSQGIEIFFGSLPSIIYRQNLRRRKRAVINTYAIDLPTPISRPIASNVWDRVAHWRNTTRRTCIHDSIYKKKSIAW